ncbi:M55 family metallopeptidase [Gudongella sp. SC589]|uniref:M55 family metallopeptidase n=1 Tax=Gudongella sp. SC589 TaxID=3385990 RepID=UPI003904CE40
MKLYISADIEGITGVTHWDETSKNKGDYSQFADQMTAEVRAACEGANELDEMEIIIKDAHDSGRNLDHNGLPMNVRLIRGWDEGLFSMVQELDDSFDGVAFIGYHSGAGMDGSPLSHTLTTGILSISINGKPVDEFMLHAYIAAYHKVPVIFLSGDKSLCQEVIKINPFIETVAVKEGRGNSTINIHPERAIELIKAGVKKGLVKEKGDLMIQLPEEFNVEVEYPRHYEARRNSFYPGASLLNSTTVGFTTDDYIEVLRFLHFTV